MAGVVFWDVDTQVDFMLPEGKLYVPGALDITENLARLTRHARARRIPRVASVCDHVPEDPEISASPDYRTTFPPHCLRGSEGQRKIPATAMESPVVVPNRREDPAQLRRRLERHTGELLVEKSEFDVFTNPNLSVLLEALQPETLVVYGVAQDVCDACAIEGFLTRGGSRVSFVEDAARSIDARRGAELLADWKRRGVSVLTTADVVAGRYA
jgi:nicotinamidase/pyrazinamidase